MLRWLPQANGLWQPVNTDAVTIYGGESLLEWKFKCRNHHQFTVNGTYAYTISENDKTQKQLIYVPYHKATAAVAYSYKRFSLDIQLLYNGEVFTSSDNAYVLDDYAVSNIGVNYDFGKNNAFQLGARMLNAWNEEYENVAVRPIARKKFYNVSNFKFLIQMKLNKLMLALFAGSLLFTSCSDNDDTSNDMPLGAYDNGILVLNEGNFGMGNAKISYISNDFGTLQNDIFNVVNPGMSLGDTGQDIGFYGDLAFIVLNVSNTIEIVNRYTIWTMWKPLMPG